MYDDALDSPDDNTDKNDGSDLDDNANTTVAPAQPAEEGEKKKREGMTQVGGFSLLFLSLSFILSSFCCLLVCLRLCLLSVRWWIVLLFASLRKERGENE